jgi:hypothetical protein
MNYQNHPGISCTFNTAGAAAAAGMVDKAGSAAIMGHAVIPHAAFSFMVGARRR